LTPRRDVPANAIQSLRTDTSDTRTAHGFIIRQRAWFGNRNTSRKARRSAQRAGARRSGTKKSGCCYVATVGGVP